MEWIIEVNTEKRAWGNCRPDSKNHALFTLLYNHKISTTGFRSHITKQTCSRSLYGSLLLSFSSYDTWLVQWFSWLSRGSMKLLFHWYRAQRNRWHFGTLSLTRSCCWQRLGKAVGFSLSSQRAQCAEVTVLNCLQMTSPRESTCLGANSH